MNTHPKNARTTIAPLTLLILAAFSVPGAGPAHAQVSTGGSVTNGGAAVTPGTQANPFITTNLTVGAAAFSPSSLSVSPGGTVTNTGSGIIADPAGALGNAVVVGGTWTNTNDLIVGNNGTGTLIISIGGTVTNTGSGIIANSAGASGSSVTVSGIRSSWAIGTNLYVGFSGGGTLTIQSGGTVTDASGEIGFTTGSSGTVTVSGPNATWTNTGTVFVGDNGTGVLTIQTGGLVQVGGFGLILSNSRFGRGTLNIGAAPGSPSGPAPPGTLETSRVIFGGSGTGVINFNHTAADYVFAPTISGPGQVNVFSGTTVFPGNNIYKGTTNITGGTLVIGAPSALGSSDVFLGGLNGGTLRTNSSETGVPLQINIGGNFRQNPSGTLELEIGGTQGEQYDRVVYGTKASLNGTLSLSSLTDSSTGKPFQPVSGDGFVLVQNVNPNNKAITRSGEFAQVNDLLNKNPGLQRIDVYAPNGVALVYVKARTPSTNPRPPIVIDQPTPLPPVDPEAPISPKFFLPILNPTVEELTSMFEIQFSGANMQRFSLGDRMFQIQQSVVPTPVVPPPPVEGKEIEGKGVEGKAPPPAPPPSPINRWGVWASGWGDFGNVDSSSAAQGYRFTLGGVSAGVDYLLIPNHLAVGLFGGYSHSWVHLTPSGSADANTGRGGLYATYFDQGWWVDVAGWGGGTNYSTGRQAILGMANGSTSGWEVSTFGEAGKDFLCGNFTFGPVVAMQYTNVHLNGFGENGSLVPLDIHGDSQDSLVTDVGARAYYTWHGTRTTIIPKVELYWEHEYLYSNLPLTISAPGLDNATTTVSGPNVGHDSMIIDASLSVHPTDRIWLTIAYVGQQARDHFNSNGVTGTLSFSF